MTLLHGREDLVPIALDVGTVRVKMCLEPGGPEDTLTDGDFLGNRNAHSDGNDAQVCNDVHSSIVTANSELGINGDFDCHRRLYDNQTSLDRCRRRRSSGRTKRQGCHGIHAFTRVENHTGMNVEA